MNQDKEINKTMDDQLNPEQGAHLENRQEQDRRIEFSEGFTYITTVGWIDRRERHRRKDDSFDY